MFGFFKSKGKDKVASKDRSTDSSKEKKKEKSSKEDKSKDVSDSITLRNKEDKLSSSRTSIFRRSKSIERSKEKDCEGPAKKRSKNLDPRKSGEWDDSSSQDASVRSSAATDEDSSIDSSGQRTDLPTNNVLTKTRISNSPDPYRPTEHDLTDSISGGMTGGGIAGNEKKLSEQSAEATAEVGESVMAENDMPSLIAPTASASQATTDQAESKWNVNRITTSAFSPLRKSSETSTSLAMKPPLNPRFVGPRGPLASSGFSLASSPTNINQDSDDSLSLHSPGIVTPPSSPGPSAIQGIPPYPIVTGPSSRPTSPDGRASMLSTPSSSTSSLTSLTSRPISPSGRRTPPGPRMGTGGRLSSSPTAGRKTVRTNIKTNPVMGSRRGGSQSPINPVGSGPNSTEIPFTDGDKLTTPPSSPVNVRHESQVVKENLKDTEKTSTIPVTPMVSQSDRSLIPVNSPVKARVAPPPLPTTKVCFPVEPKFEMSKQGSRSSSPTTGKSRHSISSVHSLESIPENDSDSQASANNTLEKNRPTSPLSCKPPSTHAVLRENKINSKPTGYATRHSAPEVSSCDRHRHTASMHKRSFSLTPVTEEKLLPTAVTLASAINNSTSGVNEAQNQLNKKAVVGGIAALSSLSTQKANSKSDKTGLSECNKNIFPDHCSRRKQHNSRYGKYKQANLDLPQTANSDFPVDSAATQERDETVLHGKVSFSKGNEDRLEMATVDMVSEEVYEKNVSDSVNRQSMSNFSQDGSPSERATHVVFRIPLRSNSCSNCHELEKRVSVEVLSGKEAKEVKRPEKHYHKKRPRSVSTSRELKRERISEYFQRKRSSSTGPEGEPEEHLSISVTEEQKDRDNKNDKDSSCDEAQVVIIPWRCRSRSHSRARELPGTENNEKFKDTTVSRAQSHSSIRDSTDSNPDKDYTSMTNNTDSKIDGDSRTRSRTRSRYLAGSKPDSARSDRLASVSSNDNHQISDSTQFPFSVKTDNTGTTADSSSHVHKSANCQLTSKDPERRMTRSVTLGELPRVNLISDQGPLSEDQMRGRRALSSSRVRETSCSKQEEGKDQPVVRRPPRRRSLSTSRRRPTNCVEYPENEHKILVTDAGVVDANHSSNISQNVSEHLNGMNDHKHFSKPSSGECSLNEKGSDVKIEATVRIRRRSSPREHDNSNKTSGGVAEIIDISTKTDGEEEGITSCSLRNSELCRNAGDLIEKTKKELAAQEERYQKQVDQLTLALAEKQEEVRALTQRLEELNGIKEKLKESEQLQVRLDALQKELREKCAAMDSVRVELQYSKNEVELTKSKLKKLEEDLDNARQKNISLQNQLTANSNCEKGEDLATKISTLEDRLKICQAEKEKLTKTIEEIEAERDDEIKIIQDALDEAAQEREELIATFEKELQNINTMNSNREQQLMEDFEWKLREIEKEHKKKLEEKDRMAEERLNAVRNLVESELAESITKVAEDRRLADEKLAEVGHLKSYEAEAIQLRGVTHELQKALRASAREMERLKMREKILEEEVRGLKKAQPSRQNTLHRHKRHADDTEAEFRQKQEKMKSELNAEWEDKLRTECSRLKAELDDLHAEEKHLAVESMKVQKEQEIRALKQSWELRQEEMAKEISTLKDSLTDKDAYYHKEMENLRTNADRDVWELRRKLQKLDEKNWTQQERLQEKHTEEMERLKQDFKEQVADLEARLAVTSQISGEDDRRQLEKSHNDEVEHLCEQHRSSMERLREELEAEKFQAVEEARVIVSEHLEHVNTSLREQLLEATCANTQYREELEAIRAALKLREEVISSLEEELMKVKGGSETAASFYKASQYSFAGSDESNSSQDRLSMSDSLDNQDDAQKSGGGSLLGKVFGGGWFSSSKATKDNGRRGSAPSTDKKLPSS
ncbi:putative leucine-rich repeat-containing protein DDB_G0290503 isoform X2 [Macrobrachium rosenbergii]|uniref:putative leucine-rich repeat-containing protein DDB_G0290503 isoform X2 n=1 Tax=Macrobrachium rosenbergii TaxID=79674 RepID=UPI0034D48266